MKKQTILRNAAILLLAILMVISPLSVANTTTPRITRDIAEENPGTSSPPANLDPVIWDNTMGIKWYLTSAQLDDSNLSDIFDSFQADDFSFTQGMQITDVHWQGGYWNLPAGLKDYGFNWTIEFYSNNATEDKPLTLLKHYEFVNASITHNMWYQTASIKFNYSVVLPQPVVCFPNTKYWVCFYAHGIFPPQTGLNIHNATVGGIKGHSAMQKSIYFNGHPNWINGSAGGLPYDINFKLTGVVAPMPVLEIETIKGPIGVTATIKNTGDANATNVKWDIAFTGGMVLLGKAKNGTIPAIAAAGGIGTAKIPLVLGFGKSVIGVNVNCDQGISASKSQNATVLLIFVLTK